MNYSLYPLGDRAILIEFGQVIHPDIQQKVQIISTFIEESMPEWLIEYIPAFTTITLFYDPIKILSKHSYILPYHFVCNEISQLLNNLQTNNTLEPRVVEIPVYYGGELGPDLEYVAEYNNLTTDEVIHIHSSGEYLVYMIGFAPGFPYLGGLSEKIATPRRQSPRLSIPPRSVGIAGEQTGIYPIETPGGWQIIGQTPLPLFLPNQNPPTMLKSGDIIKFKSISYTEFLELEGQHI
ncbi:5-oxoprolinase subunit PxpB [Bacillus massiliigorillae]|uniref:5-oxoprolinase subunit PxpB n=1 Tax=Bacillus massiliigorillae TaxID=1243664 RepID=UPI0003A551AD|nr:5-oxoprolinase subunit PxpB [Bacillus massiliigorillae]